MPSNGLLNEERRREILAALHRDGRVLVKDLARHFRISQITIRKDLEFLDAQGVIQRTHGGASPCRTEALSIQPCAEKKNWNLKRRPSTLKPPLARFEGAKRDWLVSGTTQPP